MMTKEQKQELELLMKELITKLDSEQTYKLFEDDKEKLVELNDVKQRIKEEFERYMKR